MPMEENNRKYEITFVLAKESDYDRIREILIRRGAEDLKSPKLVRIKLAYPVRKESFGFWGSTEFEIKPEAIREIKSDLKTGATALRSAIFTAPDITKTTNTKIRTRAGASLLEEKPKLVEKKIVRDYKPIEPRKETETHKPSKPAFEGELSNKDLEQKLEEILNQ